MQLQNYIDYMDSEKVRIHIGSGSMLEKEVERPVLLISHNLSVTGAPIALLDMAKILIKNGRQVFVIALLSGDVMEDFLCSGSVVLTCADRNIDTVWLKKTARIFPLTVVNTLALAPLVSLLLPVTQRLFWWIHESDYFFRELKYGNIPVDMSLRILAASPKVSGLISEYMGRDSDILNVMVEDRFVPADRPKENRLIYFLWAGFINSNKMPELFLQAILELPENYRKCAGFTFCGDGVDSARKNMLQDCADIFPDIFYIPFLPHDQLIELMKEMDAVVVCSKEETTSLVAVEGLMLGKVVICSDGCGIADYLNDGTDAYIFPAENYSWLCQKIKHVIDHYDELTELRKAGRAIYEQHFTEKTFEKRVLGLLEMSDS